MTCPTTLTRSFESQIPYPQSQYRGWQGHGTMGLRQCWECWGQGTGQGQAHFAPRRSEMHVFPLEIRVPTRPGLERLIGHGQCPWSGQAGSSWWEGRARAEPRGFRRRAQGAEPLPVGTEPQNRSRAEGSHGHLFTRGPGRTDGELYLQVLLSQLAL